MSEQDESGHNDRRERPEPSLSEGVSDLVNAAFGLGAALTRTLAQATALGKPVQRPPEPSSPVGEMVHYGVTTVTNVVGLVISAFGSAERGGAAPAAEAKAGASRGPEATRPAGEHIPSVHQGNTLRVPLSLENPSAHTMEGLHFQCLQLTLEGEGEGTLLGPEAVRFEPAMLSIAPKDFEKLTVMIETRADTAPGRYAAVIGVQNGSLEIRVQFAVVPAAPD